MRRLFALVLLLALAGCGSTPAAHRPSSHPHTSASGHRASPAGSPTGHRPPRSAGRPRVIGTIASHLQVPWGIAFLPDGSALVTERDTGRVLHLTGHGRRWHVHAAGHLAETSVPGGESGLLGIAVSPGFTRDHRVFLYVSTPGDNRVVRSTYSHGRLGPVHPVLTGIPRGVHHDGGGLTFGPDGYLYVSTGESGVPSLAQDLHSLGGKILRITQSGRPAPGDPFGHSPIWTYGHRNVEGLAVDPHGRLWASEFGDRGFDELNLIHRGGNYGWPYVQGKGGSPKYVDPRAQWPTEEASPSGLAYDAGSFWLGALAGERLWQVPVHGTHTGPPKPWFIGRFGRMRSVVRAPDGNLWVTTSNRDGRGSPAPDDDRILLIRP